MELKHCIMTNSKCYKESTHNAKVGIIVHSTGANNPNIARYVQPSDNDPDYEEIIQDIGKNRYKTDWNHAQVQKGVHAFIGKTAKNEVAVYKVMPYGINAWGVAAGAKGSVNYGANARIQFEVCEDNLQDEEYFTAALQQAIKYCAFLCHEYGWDPDKAIWSHYEANQNGYGSGSHVDIDHWLKRYGYDMNWFRQMVKDEFHCANNEFLSRVTYLKGQTVILSKEAVKYNKKPLPTRLLNKTFYIRKVKGDKISLSLKPHSLFRFNVSKQYCIK